MAIAFHTEIYVPGQSWVHRWAARPKLLSLLTFMLAISLLHHLVLVPWALGVVAVLYGCAKLPIAYLWRRLPYPGLFILAMVGVLPWMSGETVIWQWHWLSLRQEGLAAAALIAGRFLAIITTGFILLGTTPFLDILKALRSLGFPVILTDMTLLTYRYLYDIATQLFTMQQAMQLRGYGLFRQTLKRQWGWLVGLFGSLLLRSYERSQRVYKAMRLRGYGEALNLSRTVNEQAVSRVTYLATTLTLCATLSFVLGEWILTHL